MAGAAGATGGVVAVLAHPDDEVLGCGILLSRLERPTVVHVTDGSPRDGADAARLGFASPREYARVRRRELEAAMALAGILRSQLVDLGIADQGVARSLEEVTRRLVPLLRGRPVVLTHAYEGGHPDHDATCFAVHRAVRLLGPDAPTIVDMPFYRAGATDWIRQAFVPSEGAGDVVALQTTDDERRMRRHMVAAHATQASVLAGFTGEEQFRLAPPYDFGALPNNGVLLYERYGWGLSAGDWLDQVRRADAALANDGSSR